MRATALAAALVAIAASACGAQRDGDRPPRARVSASSATPPPTSSAAPPATPPATPGSPTASAAVPQVAPPPRRPGSYANLDPDDDLVVGPPEALPTCEEELARAKVTFQRGSIPVHTDPRSKIVCGAPQIVTYMGGPAKIAYGSPPVLTCAMALALASFERIVQEEAERHMRSAVIRIDHIGTYSCRGVVAYPGLVSEHSYANALDVTTFSFKSGARVDVLKDFDRSEGPTKKPAGAFLRAVSQRAHDEDVFSHVLTPFFDRAHDNHFHLDLARFRTDGTRPGKP